MNFQNILDRFPSSTTNNARAIVRNLMERYYERPSYGVLKRLEALGVGVEDDGFYLIDKSEVNITDEELAINL